MDEQLKILGVEMWAGGRMEGWGKGGRYWYWRVAFRVSQQLARVLKQRDPQKQGILLPRSLLHPLLL